MSFAFLFPGQGSQSLKMMAGFDGLNCIKATFDEASTILDQDLWAMINGQDAELINATVNTQPIMLAAAIATYRAYLTMGGRVPSIVAGHSLGEYSALVVAESLSYIDAVRLVHLRAQLMQDAIPQGVGAMAAILGLDDETVKAVCLSAAQNQVVDAVNFNAPGQVVIAGNKEAVERAMIAAKKMGAKRALPLPVSVPSHCSLMQGAAEKLQVALMDITIQTPKIRVIHNADVASFNDPIAIKDTLVRQLYSPVRWTETINLLATEQILQTAECGPGKILTGLCKRINDQVISKALINIETVKEFIETH